MIMEQPGILSKQVSSKTQFSSEAYGVFKKGRNTEVLPEGYNHLTALNNVANVDFNVIRGPATAIGSNRLGT